jgi:hypothetical protein
VKRFAVAVAFCVTALVVAGAARAVPPPLVSVGQQARHPTAILGPLPGVDAAFIYVATKPDRASDGSFPPGKHRGERHPDRRRNR